MINYTEQLMYGLKPVHREEPQAGQSEYYYFDPRYGDDDARHVVDVPDGTSPNPNADAIQQYLYENDEYRYKNLYGDTPPPPVQTQKGTFEQFGDNLGNIAKKTGIDKLTENLYNLGYDAAERFTYPQSNAQNYENKSSLAQAQAEAQRLTPIKEVSDINKHQYVSCVGAFDGPISAGATAAAGLYKEGADLYKKWNNTQYGSNWQILQDSFKDLKNDALGISRGWSANNIDDCNYLLPPNARRR